MDSGFQLFTLERENDGEIGAGAGNRIRCNLTAPAVCPCCLRIGTKVLTVSTVAGDCPKVLDGYTQSAGNHLGSLVRTHYGRPAGTVPCFRSHGYSLRLRFSSNVNAAGCSSDVSARQQRQHSFRNCSRVRGRLADLICVHTCLHVDCDLDRGPTLDTVLEHWNWRLL
jgi:hypothetical protein